MDTRPIYKAVVHKHKGHDPHLSTVDIVGRANTWLIEQDLYHHMLNWYDNTDDVVFVMTDRTTALQLKLSL